ncbi:MAG: tRNA pseudouridine(55) synthase TruB [Desulfamplus sp.]|nr:tRNA pseudouridine(55) synthase TruB [Desulfamplus sp.]
MTISGIIAIDKPSGISSAAVVAKIKRKLGVKKVGHTGTLDPFATGLMLCGVNKGTKLSQFFLGSSKGYVAQIALGVNTDTYDYTGQITDRASFTLLSQITDAQIVKTIQKFKGEQMQTPPIYSALKHNGKPLYQLAREGKPVQKPPRKIEIHSIELQEIKRGELRELNRFFDQLSVIVLIDCSSGTYIRSLAYDIGKQLGCGGTLLSLRRVKTCRFSIDDATPLDEFEALSQDEAFSLIIPMNRAISFMPEIKVDDFMVKSIGFGRPFSLCSLEEKSLSESLFKVIDKTGELVAIVKYDKALCKYDYCCVFVN